MNKLTKIVATIGPVCESEEMIEKLINAGVNIFRFNFKHNTVEWHSERIERVNKVAERMGKSIGTLIDLQGPEIRINMPVDQIEVAKDQHLLLGEESFEKKEVGFSITHPDIIRHLTDGQRIVADDGAFTFHVEKKDEKTYLVSHSEGILKHRKTLNIPGADFPFPVLIDRDFEGLKLAKNNEVTYVALSFVRSAEDLRVVKKEAEKYGFTAKLVSKIETQKALDDIDAIIDESDAVMIARGDLGVEMPIEQVPFYQKLLIKKCLEKGKAVITATQMLQTMIDNPFPTRAEVSDVANACYDLTDCVMLSGETASGKYPLETVEMMANTIAFNEAKFLHDTRNDISFKVNNPADVMAEAAYNIYLKLKKQNEPMAGFVVYTHSGKTAQLLSRYHPMAPIFTFAPSETICNELTIHFGVYPLLSEESAGNEIKKEDILKTIKTLEDKQMVKKGEKVVVLHGDYWAEGTTSTVKVVTV